MGHAHGYRSGTRHSFARPFRQHGTNIGLQQYLRPIRMGDYVDIAVNGTFHKGMPYKLYHGRTGIVYNVSRRGVGVEFNKQVRNRIVKKRVSIRTEHIQPSKCRKDFLDRVQRNETLKRKAKEEKKPVDITAIKRFPVGPRGGQVVKAEVNDGSDAVFPELVAPSAFDDML